MCWAAKKSRPCRWGWSKRRTEEQIFSPCLQLRWNREKSEFVPDRASTGSARTEHQYIKTISVRAEPVEALFLCESITFRLLLLFQPHSLKHIPNRPFRNLMQDQFHGLGLHVVFVFGNPALAFRHLGENILGVEPADFLVICAIYG